MPFVILPTNSASGGYDITNSLRFNSGSSDYLNRTPASAGNRQKFTISFWVKRSALSSSTSFTLLSAGADGTEIRFTQDKFRFYYYSGAYIGEYYYQSTAVFRDVSAWYHLVIAVDTTQATAGDRLKMYVNGVEGAVASTTITQNASTDWNNNGAHYIGKFSNGSMFYFDGYMSDIYSIDGQQLTPSSFGETDFDTGIWKPKAYTGSYGTNGFYLQFKNSASLGTDSSGNGNTFTVNNLTSIDQTTDTPTNNFCTLNPLVSFRNTLSEGNLNIAGDGSNWKSTPATIAVRQGKWYWEIKNIGQYSILGIASVDWVSAGGANELGQAPVANATVQSYGLRSDNGNYYANNGNTSATVTTGVTSSWTTATMSIALDLDNSKIYFYKNGTIINSGGYTIASGLDYFPCNSDINNTQYNFGNPPYSGGSFTDSAGRGNFSYSVPSGFYALCTANLSTQG